MVVISQDRKTLVNFNKVLKMMIVEETKIILEYDNIDLGEEYMGKYSTAEKAYAVLDMLFEACAKNRKCFKMPRDERVRIGREQCENKTDII